MKEIKIFEPAMCCETGLCGVGVDPELMRISTVINTLKEKGIVVERFNLSNAPQAFVDNKVVNDFINQYGADNLPVTLVDEQIKAIGHYPSNAEFTEWLALSDDVLNVSQGECCCGSDDNSESCCGSGNSSEGCCDSNNSSDSACCSGGGCC